MAAETGFLIDGTLYELPPLDTFTMDEVQVLYEYSGLALEDFVERENETEAEAADRERQFKNPGLLRALMHVAYQRGNPKMKASTVKQLIGAANVVSALQNLAGDQEEDEAPLALTTEPAQPLPSGSVASSESSGNDSTTASDQPESPLEPTGTGRLDTSSPESAPKLSVA